MQVQGGMRALSLRSVIAGLLSSVAVIVPGYLTLVVHKPELIEALEAPMIMLICSGVTLPMLFAQLRFIGAGASPSSADGAVAIWIALGRTWAILFASLSISYLFDACFETHVAITAAVQALVWSASRPRPPAA